MNTLRPPPLDNAELRARFEGRPDLLRRMIKIFDEQTPRLLARLQEAVGRKDAPGIRSAAHTLKGSLLQFGAHTAAGTAGQLEQSGDSSSPLLDQLNAQVAEVQQYLNTLDV